MSRNLITMRLRSVRWDVAFESLERRQVMSAAAAPSAAAPLSLNGVSVSPGDGQIYSVDSPPRQIVVSLAQANLAGVSLNFWWQPGPIRLERIGPNGATTTFYDADVDPTAIFDDATATVTIPLTAPLQPGGYRIVLVGGTPLSRLLAGSTQVPGQDQTLAEFSVVGKTTTLGDAVDLGAIGSNVATVSGALDPQAGSVALYKITLGADQPLWRLGLQLDTQRIGSPLRSALTLFDQQGRAIASRTAGQGLGTTVDDPYLFAALKPGVYYVGISGAGNLGGQPGGYDPTTGAPGYSPTNNDSGPFQLQLVADPLTTPMDVSGFSLAYSDPTSASTPTGFSITFSDAVDPVSLRQAPLFVQNEQGQMFPVILSSVGSGLNQLDFLFDRPLAPGRYSLVVPQGGGLTDLIGRTPISTNLPSGTLATWTVEASPTSSNGVAPIPVTFTTGDGTRLAANGESVLPVGGQVVFRLVVPPVSGGVLYITAPTNSLRVEQLGGGATVVVSGTRLDAGAANTASNLYGYILPLDKGVYALRLTSTDDADLTFEWRLTLDRRDSFLANAVGSAGALSLRMVGTTSTGGSSNSSEATSPISPAAAPAPMVVGKLPSSYTVTVASILVGRPTVGNDPTSTAGSSAPGGLVATTAEGRGSAAGVVTASGRGDDGSVRDPEGLVATKTEDDLAARHGSRSLAEAPPRSVDARSSDEIDILALLEADRLAEGARNVGWWLLGDAEAPRVVVATSGRLRPSPRAMVEGDADQARQVSRSDLEASGEVERAALGAPVGLIVAAAAAFRFRQAVRRWWRRRLTADSAPRVAQAPLWRGPRYMVPHQRREPRRRKLRHLV